MKIKFIVSYDGTDYCGWQRQNHGTKLGISQVITEAIEKVLNEKIILFASGRTDAGVHALNQVCHFVTTKDLTPKHGKPWDFCWAVNAHLPPAIVLKKAWIAPDEFHATISPTHKTYRYFILNRFRASPFLTRNADWVRKPIDINYLNECCQYIIGTHDFKSFQSVGTPVPHTVREVMKAEWTYRRPHLLQFSITGEGFLKQMVRNIVGTQLFLWKKGLKPSEMGEILKKMDRKMAGPPAPPQGLFLYKVYYPQDLDKQCLEI